MSKSIQDFVNTAESTAVITGRGHVPFFKDRFLPAQFPLRQTVQDRQAEILQSHLMTGLVGHYGLDRYGEPSQAE